MAPAAVSWDGGANTWSWHDAANWNPNQEPQAADEVTIKDLQGPITITKPVTIKSLKSDTPLLIKADAGPPATIGSLTLSEASTINDMLALEAGSLTVNKTLDIKGLFSWTKGTLNGPGTTTAWSFVDINGDNPKNLENQTFKNLCDARWQGKGEISINGKGLWINESKFDIQTDAKMRGNSENGFKNNGQVVKTKGADTSLVDVSFQNEGTVAVESGKMRLNKGYNRGPLSVKAGTSLTLMASHYLLLDGTKISGAGRVIIGDGTFTLTKNRTVTMAAIGILEISPPASLEGVGSHVIDANVDNAGHVRPGGDQAIGSFTITRDYIQRKTGELRFESNGTLAAPSFDSLSIIGNATLGGKLDGTRLNPAVSLTGAPALPVLTYGTLASLTWGVTENYTKYFKPPDYSTPNQVKVPPK